MIQAIGTTFDYKIPIAQQFAEIARTSFKSVSLGANIPHSNYLSSPGRQRLIELAARYKISIDSLHVPFSEKYDIACSQNEPRMAAVCRVAMCMVAAKELGASTVILHLNSTEPTAIGRDSNSLVRSLEGLIESAEIMKLRLAAENLWEKESLEYLHRALDEYTSPCFGFCYDSSHDQLSGEAPYEILERYAKRLFALHLSDNDGTDDKHWIPFTGIVDWERICGSLRGAAFAGPLLLEVENNDAVDTVTFLKKSSEAAQRLQEMITA